MPFVFIGTLFSIKEKLAKILFMQKFGNLSFGIYLFSPLIGYLCWELNQRYIKAANSLWLILLIQLLICMSSFHVSKLLYANHYLNRILFPRSVASWKELFQSKIKDTKQKN